MIFKSNRSFHKYTCAILLLLFFSFSTGLAHSSAPEFFTYTELETLYEQENLPPQLEIKLHHLLTTPFVETSTQNSKNTSFTRSPRLGKFLRVAHWNIQRGLEFEAIEAIFESAQRFESLLDKNKFPIGSSARREILDEAEHLRQADVIVFNEVDLGMKRTDYRFVASELAKKLNMNYAFGTQFIELTPVNLTQQKVPDDIEEKELAKIIKVDPTRYKGLHGIAILSRFPLENVRLLPFKHQPYNWYIKEKNGAGWFEKGKRIVSKKIFLEESLREVRRGGRATLLADIVDEHLPSGRVTIAATHLENRTRPANRLKQLKELLEIIKSVSNPVIVSGDMNTSGSDLTPTSLRRELMKRYGNKQYWIKKALQYALGFGIFEDIVMDGLTFGRTMNDPTVKSIPFFSRNTERKFFTTLEKFRFDDGGAFDFRGEQSRSIGDKSNTLANSNQRGQKGFITTYQVKRPVYVVGKYKLDWIFVKPADLKNPRNEKGSHRFAPHYGETLMMINEAVENRISDHRPLTIDLPLQEPNIN